MANGIQWFNALSWTEAERTLSQVCPSPAFVSGMLAARPCPSDADLIEHANRVLASLPEEELGVALTGYRFETGPQDGIRTQLSRAAAAYEAKFGQAFVATHDDRSDTELLTLVLDRLDNDVETEHEIVRAELANITRSRLAQLLTLNGSDLYI